MRPEDWSKLSHFSIEEKTRGYKPAWGQPSKMNLYVLMQLDAMRKYVGHTFRIHCGYDTAGHTSGSYHSRNGMGRAIDFDCPDVDVEELFMVALRFDFTGVGKYAFWNNPGLHVDVRPLSHFEPTVCWLRDRSGVYVYY